jgi:hypothetical protein
MTLRAESFLPGGRIAIEGTSAAKEEADNYGLSVWREVKVALTDDP